MSTVYVTQGDSSYHRDIACQALDTACLNNDGQVRAIGAGGTTRTPCLVCAGQPGVTEWVLTRENLGELMELATFAKPHKSYPPGSKTLVVDGLTIWNRHDGPRQWARFGDTIRRDGRQWTVTSPAGESR